MGFAAALEGPHFVGPDATFRRAVVGFTQVDGGKCGFFGGFGAKKQQLSGHNYMILDLREMYLCSRILHMIP